jgi:Pathogenicity locus
MVIRDDSRELLRIPGVGPSIARDLLALGIRRVEDLAGGDAQRLYDRLCALRGHHIDRCVLYVFRCAVYFAAEPSPDPELLKWWSWKDGRAPATLSSLASGGGS